jgi:hypothetical protein
MIFPIILGLASAASMAQPSSPATNEQQPASEVGTSEEVICRTRVRPSERMGERLRSVRICRTRAEWAESRPSSRRGSN